MIKLTAIKDDYDGYLAHIKMEPDQAKRNDIKTVIRWVMIKRTIIKIAELIIVVLATTGIVSNFL